MALQCVVRNLTNAALKFPSVFNNITLAAATLPGSDSPVLTYNSISKADLATLVSLAAAGSISFPGSLPSVDQALPVKPNLTYCINGQEPTNVSNGETVYSITDGDVRVLVDNVWVTVGHDVWTVIQRNNVYADGQLAMLPNGQVFAVNYQQDPFNFGDRNNLTKTCEVFDPSSDSWLNTGTNRQYFHTQGVVTTLRDGRVMKCLGLENFIFDFYNPPYGPQTPTGDAHTEMYSYKTGKWSVDTDTVPFLGYGWQGGAPSVVMCDGRVLVTGLAWLDTEVDGAGLNLYSPLMAAYVYGDVTGTAPNMTFTCPFGGPAFLPSHVGQKVTLQGFAHAANNGAFTIVSVSGDGSSITYTNASGVANDGYDYGANNAVGWIDRYPAKTRVMIYDPSAASGHKWKTSDSDGIAPLHTARAGCSLTLMADGRVMAVGGMQGGNCYFTGLADCEIYNPTTKTISGQAPGTWMSTSAPPSRDGQDAYLLTGGNLTGPASGNMTLTIQDTGGGQYPWFDTTMPSGQSIFISNCANPTNNGYFTTTSISSDGLSVTFANSAGIAEAFNFDSYGPQGTIIRKDTSGISMARAFSLPDGRVVVAPSEANSPGQSEILQTRNVLIYTPGSTISGHTYTDDFWQVGPELPPSDAYYGADVSNFTIFTQATQDQHGNVYVIGGQDPAGGNVAKVSFYDWRANTLTPVLDMPYRRDPNTSDGIARWWTGAPIGMFGSHESVTNSAVVLRDGRILLCNAASADSDAGYGQNLGTETALYYPGVTGRPSRRPPIPCGGRKRRDRRYPGR